MLKQSVTYVDFNGEQQTEELYFNLNEPEILELDLQFEGGLGVYIETLDEKEDPAKIFELFTLMLTKSYGEKSEDGRHFLKSQERSELFVQSAAYAALFRELLTDVDKATSFFERLVTSAAVTEAAANGNVAGARPNKPKIQRRKK